MARFLLKNVSQVALSKKERNEDTHLQKEDKRLPPKRSQKWAQDLPTRYFLLRKTCNDRQLHKTTPTDLFVKSICLFRQLFDDRNTCFVLKSARPVKYNDKYTNKCSHLNRFTKRAQKRAQEAHPW